MNAPQPLDDRTRVRVAGSQPSGYTLAMNVVPFVHLAAGVALIAALGDLAAAIAAGLAWVYLLPPLAVRVAVRMFGPLQGRDLTQESRAYKLWWFATQWQVVFNRLPFLEECLRIVPMLYPLWLALWGSRVSCKVYWGPGALLTDRMLAEIGAGVVIGTRAVISAHLAAKDAVGALRVTVAPVYIGDEVLIGAYAGIGPGCRIESGAQVPAASFLRPDTHWRPGGAHRGARPRSR